jgi:hypothetical protein
LALSAYLDDSGTDGQSPVVVIGGFFTDESRWDVFKFRWASFLTGFEIKRFHASDFWARRRPFHSWDNAKHQRAQDVIVDILTTSNLVGICKGVHIPSFNEWRVDFTHHVDPDPYYFCLDKCLKFLIAGVKKSFGRDDSISIYIDNDEGREKRGRSLAHWHQEKVRLGHSFHVNSDRQTNAHYVRSYQFSQLQAADILANEYFKQAMRFIEKREVYDPPFLAAMKEAKMPLVFEFLHDKELFEIDARSRSAEVRRRLSFGTRFQGSSS